jgi:hypothetical protein
MASSKHPLPMVSAGLSVLRVRPGCDKISILTVPAGAASSCPVCGMSNRIQVRHGLKTVAASKDAPGLASPIESRPLGRQRSSPEQA